MSDDTQRCALYCPPTWTGHWRDWHREDHACTDPRFSGVTVGGGMGRLLDMVATEARDDYTRERSDEPAPQAAASGTALTDAEAGFALGFAAGRIEPPAASPGVEALCVVFDGPPGPQSGRFVEVEDGHGHGVNVGTWRERTDGLWELTIPFSGGSWVCDGCGAQFAEPDVAHGPVGDHRAYLRRTL